MTKAERFAGSITQGATYVKRGKVNKAEGDMITYFGQTDMGKTIFALYRKRPADGITYQEHWNPSTSSWDTTTSLMRLLTGGDCTLTEIREEDAMKAFPVAFPA
jgi:hypothetical protein